MHRKSRFRRFAHSALPFAVLMASACESGDIDRMARIGRKAAAHLQEVTGDARGKLAEGWRAVQASMDNSSVEGRVTARIRWEKAAIGADIQVSCPGPGIVVLRGTVTESARSRVKELAEGTEGVEKVVDELTVSP